MDIKKRFVMGTLLLLTGILTVGAQDAFFRETHDFRQKHYREELIKMSPAPFLPEELRHLNFYNPDTSYRVIAVYEPVSQPNDTTLGRITGEADEFRNLGRLWFNLMDKPYCLDIYAPKTLKKGQKNYIFLGFKDKTSGKETYGGGRYIEITFTNLKNRKFILDFNKAYNPLCAYSEGYRCILIPQQNFIDLPVRAGEKKYTKPLPD